MPLSNNYLIDNFSGTSTPNWTPREGVWSVANGEYRANFSDAVTQANNFIAKDLVFECDIMLGSNFDSGMTLRSVDGLDGYFILFRRGDNAIWVRDFHKELVIERANNVGIVANTWTRIRIIMIKDRLLVYYNNVQAPQIDMKTNTYDIRSNFFLRSWFNETAYRAMRLYELKDFYAETLDQLLLTKWIPYKGNFTIENERIRSAGDAIDLLIANTEDMSDFRLEASLRIDDNRDSGFMLRSSTGWNEDGFYVAFDARNSTCTIFDLTGMSSIHNNHATNLNISRMVFFHVTIICSGNSIQVFVNDAQIINTTSSRFSSGKVGIRSFHNQCDFDNIIIRKI